MPSGRQESPNPPGCHDRRVAVLSGRITAIPYLSQPSAHARVQPFWRRLYMKRSPDKRKFLRPKTKLGLPDLDQSKAAVLGSLRSSESQRGYRHAIDGFIEWYCSEPRLSFNRTVVLRYRMQLESRNLAQSMFGWLRFVDWRTRPQMLVYVALRVQRSSVSGLEIGYPRVRRGLCGDLPTLTRSKANATGQLLLFCSAVVFDGESW